MVCVHTRVCVCVCRCTCMRVCRDLRSTSDIIPLGLFTLVFEAEPLAVLSLQVSRGGRCILCSAGHKCAPPQPLLPHVGAGTKLRLYAFRVSTLLSHLSSISFCCLRISNGGTIHPVPGQETDSRGCHLTST